jgi:hypothetical protein
MLPEVSYPARARVEHSYLDVVVLLVAFGFALLLVDIENTLSRIAVTLERRADACAPR